MDRKHRDSCNMLPCSAFEHHSYRSFPLMPLLPDVFSRVPGQVQPDLLAVCEVAKISVFHCQNLAVARQERPSPQRSPCHCCTLDLKRSVSCQCWTQIHQCGAYLPTPKMSMGSFGLGGGPSGKPFGSGTLSSGSSGTSLL